MINKGKLRTRINNFYTRDALIRIYEGFFKKWIDDGVLCFNLSLSTDVDIDLNLINKSKFNEMLYEFYANESNFTTIFMGLSDKFQQIFIELSHNIVIDIDQFERDNGIQLIPSKEKYVGYDKYVEDVRNLYPFFKYYNPFYWKSTLKGFLLLDLEIINVIRNYLPKSEEFELHSYIDNDSKYNIDCEEEALESILFYIEFIKMGKLKFASNGKILKTSIKELKEFCKITEYYEGISDNNLKYNKCSLILNFFNSIRIKLLDLEQEKKDIVKQIYNLLLTGEIFKKEDFIFLKSFLPHIKGINNIWNGKEYTEKVFKHFDKLLKSLESNKWYDIENLYQNIFYNNSFIELVDFGVANDYLYIVEEDYGRQKIDNPRNYLELIIKPFLNIVFYIFNMLGIIEIAYDTPKNNSGFNLRTDFLYEYNGLKYIKVTNLGKYILGISSFEAEAKTVEENTNILMDDERLIITVLGKSNSLGLFIENIAEKISEEKYLVTGSSFLSGIKTEQDLLKRINKFKHKIRENPPKNWEVFFNDVTEKLNSLSFDENMLVVKIKNDKKLIEILAQDEILNKYILKAEKLYMIFHKDNKELIFDRLNEFKYFNDKI